ncbi:hypothetical protein FBU30_005787 [Linnemannia zychae]|nr:hypothetical protein FBU30_005787 [Linnemannia zychae]
MTLTIRMMAVMVLAVIFGFRSIMISAVTNAIAYEDDLGFEADVDEQPEEEDDGGAEGLGAVEGLECEL